MTGPRGYLMSLPGEPGRWVIPQPDPPTVYEITSWASEDPPLYTYTDQHGTARGLRQSDLDTIHDLCDRFDGYMARLTTAMIGFLDMVAQQMVDALPGYVKAIQLAAICAEERRRFAHHRHVIYRQRARARTRRKR